jgi:uncharacterized membrane protein YcaP (DUF421 family)
MSSGNSTSESSSIFPFNFLDNAFVVDFDLLISIVIRTVVVTLFVFLVIRWTGHKGLGQLNMYELLILIGLGSAIGDPMIYRDMSLVQAFTAIVIVIAMFKLIDIGILKSKRFQKFAESDPILLAKDGDYDEEGLRKARITKADLQMHMRLKDIRDISEVESSYLEINGQVSMLRKQEAKKDTSKVADAN